MNPRCLPAVFLPILLLLSVIACNSPTQNGLKPGDYTGSLVVRGPTGQLEETTVSAKISQEKSDSWSVTASESSSDTHENLTFLTKSDGTFELAISSRPSSFSLPVTTLASAEDCYTNSGSPSIRVCITTDLLVEVRDKLGTVYSLSLHPITAGTITAPEVPATYSLDQAMEHAFNTSFESRAQFERAMQASHVATNAWWNLLPRLNIGSGLTTAKSVTGGFLELLGTIGDFAPFLLPTRWIAAENASKQADVAKMGLTLMRGDTGAQLEALIYSWRKDGDLLQSYETILQSSQKLEAQVRDLEVFGLYPSGTADTIETTVNQMKADQAAVAATFDDERATISQAMGFVNPNAVTAVTMQSPADEPELDHLQEDSFEADVLKRSLELTQMDRLLEIAQGSKTGAYFQWLDPSGDPNASLGLGLPSAIQIAQDQVNQLEIARTQLEATIRQKARQALDDYETAKDQAALATSDLSLQQEREKRVLELVKFSKDTNLVELVGVYQDLLRAQVNARTAQASIQVARVKLNRLLLLNYYSQLGDLPKRIF